MIALGWSESCRDTTGDTPHELQLAVIEEVVIDGLELAAVFE